MANTGGKRDFRSIIEEGLGSILGQEPVPKADELAREIILRLKHRIQTEKWRTLPYRVVSVHLRPSTKRMARRFTGGLLENGSLKSSLDAILKKEDDVVLPENFELSLVMDEAPVRRESTANPPALFEIDFLEPVPKPERRTPNQRIEILKGRAEKQLYHFSKDRMLIGSLPEVHDKEGRLVRKNNVVFPQDGGEINATVGTMHARIWFDPEMGEFRIMDESSRYGTRLVRAGHTIEVPAENLRGVGLRSGDEICFGQACVMFLLIEDSE